MKWIWIDSRQDFYSVFFVSNPRIDSNSISRVFFIVAQVSIGYYWNNAKWRCQCASAKFLKWACSCVAQIQCTNQIKCVMLTKVNGVLAGGVFFVVLFCFVDCCGPKFCQCRTQSQNFALSSTVVVVVVCCEFLEVTRTAYVTFICYMTNYPLVFFVWSCLLFLLMRFFWCDLRRHWANRASKSGKHHP